LRKSFSQWKLHWDTDQLEISDPRAERMPTSMPTAAKAVGAATFAIVGGLIANAYVPGMPDAGAAGGIRGYSAVIGAFVGWSVMGNSVGYKYLDAIGHGWKTVIVLLFIATLCFSIYEVMIQSTRQVYPGPIEAILDILPGCLAAPKRCSHSPC